MKTINKIKLLIITFIIAMVMAFTSFDVSVTPTVEAAAMSPGVEFTYKVYNNDHISYEGWTYDTSGEPYLQYSVAELLLFKFEFEAFADKYSLTYEDLWSKVADASLDVGEYIEDVLTGEDIYGLIYEESLGRNNQKRTSNPFASYSDFISFMPSEITDVVPGQEIIIDVSAKVFNSAGTEVDFTTVGVALKLESSFYEPGSLYGAEMYGSSSKFFKTLDMLGTKEYPRILYDNDEKPLQSGSTVDLIYLTVSNTFSGSYNIEMVKDPDGTIAVNTSYAYDGCGNPPPKYSTNPSQFSENIITVQTSGPSDSTDLDYVKVDGTAYNKGVDGATGINASVNTAGSATTQANADLYTKSGHFVNNTFTVDTKVDTGKGSVVEYKAGTSISAAMSASATTSNSFTLPSSLAGGDSYFVLILAESEDGLNTKYHVVEVIKESSADNELEGVKISSTSSNMSAYIDVSGTQLTSITNAGGALNTSYTIYVASDETAFTITYIFSSPKTATNPVGGSPLVSGTVYPITLNSTGNTEAKIRVKAENGVTKDYTFTIKKKSVDNSLNTPTITGTVTNTVATVTGASSPWNATGLLFTDTGFKMNVTLPANATATYTSNQGGSGNIISGNNTISFNNVSGYGAHTETYTITVTSEAGTIANYDITVVRSAANNNSSILDNSSIEVIPYVGSTVQSAVTAQLDSGNAFKLPSQLDFTVTKFAIKVTLADGTYATYSATCGTQIANNLASATASSTVNFASSLPITSSETKTVNITVKAQDSTTTSYTLTVEREAPDTDVTVSSIVVYLGSSSTPIQLFKDSSTGKYSLDSDGNKVIAAYTDANYFIQVVLTDATKQRMTFEGSNLANNTKSSGVSFGTTATAIVGKDSSLVVFAEGDSDSETYTISIGRAAADVNTSLSDLKVYGYNAAGTRIQIGSLDVATQTVNLDPLYVGGLPFTWTKFEVDATAAETTSTVTYNPSSKMYTFSGSGVVTGTIDVTCTAQSGASNTISVTVMRQDAEDDTDLTITGTVNIPNSTGVSTTTFTKGTVTSTNVIYTNDTPVSYSATTITLTISIASTLTTLSLNVNGTSTPILSGNSETFNLTTNNTLTIIQGTIKTEANSGRTIQIKINTEAPSSNANASFDIVDITGNPLAYEAGSPAISGNVFTYTIRRAIATTFYLKVTLADPTAVAEVTVNSTSYNPYNPNQLYNIETDLLTVKVTPQSGSLADVKTYQIKTQFLDERDINPNIADITINEIGAADFTFNQTVLTYPSTGAINVPYSVTSLTYSISTESTTTTLYNGGTGYLTGLTGTVNLHPGNNTIYIQGQAENTTYKSGLYKIVVNRQTGNPDNYITSLQIAGIDCFTANASHFTNPFDRTMNTGWYFLMPNRTDTSANIILNVSTGAQFTIAASTSSTSANTTPFTATLTGQMVTITVSVVSEAARVDAAVSGTTPIPNVYTFKIFAASTDTKLNNLEIQDADGNLPNDTVSGSMFTFNPNVAVQDTFNIPFSTRSLELVTTKNISFQTVTGDGTINTSTFSGNTARKFVVTVTSELGTLDSTIPNQKFDYEIYIKRAAADSEKRLSSLEIIIDSVSYIITEFNPDTYTGYTIANLTTTSTQLQVKARAMSSVATINGTYVGQADYTETLDLTSGTQVVRVTCKAEDGTDVTYQVVISKTVITLDTICDLNDVKVFKSGDTTTNLLTPTYISTTLNYDVTLPASSDFANINTVLGAATARLAYKIGATGTYTPVGTSFQVPVAENQTVEVYLQVTAEDGVTKSNEYIVKIKRGQRSVDCNLSDLFVNTTPVPGFVPSSTGPYIVNLSTDTTAYLNPVLPAGSVATITNTNDITNPLTLVPGNNTLTVTVVAENPAYMKTYIVMIVKDADLTLSDLKASYNGTNLLTPAFTATNNNYTISLDYAKDYLDISYTAVGGSLVTVNIQQQGGAPISGTRIMNIPVGTTTYVVSVVGASGTTNDYLIAVTRSNGDANNEIATYVTESGEALTISPGVDTYDYIIPRSHLTYAPTITLVSSNATYQIVSSTNLTPGMCNTKIVEVTSETGVVKQYYFNVYPCDDNSTITDINVLDTAGGNDVLDSDGTTIISFETSNFTITVPYSVTQVYLEVLGGGFNSKIYVNGNIFINSLQTLNATTDTVFEIYIISEYGLANPTDSNGKSDTYTVTIKREAANADSTLKKLTVTYLDENNVTQTIECNTLPANSPFLIENIGDAVTNVTIYAESTIPAPKSTLSGDIGTLPLTNLNISSGSVTGYIFNFSVTCTAEDGSSTQYPIIISRGPADLNQDNSITYIEVEDSEGNVYLDQSTFNVSTTTYGDFVIPFTANSYTITVVKLNVSPSTTYIDSSAVASNTKQFTITPIVRLSGGQNHRVYCISQSGVKGQEYTINIKFVQPNSDATLKDLLADGVTVDGFTPTDLGGVYTLTSRPNNITTLTIDFVKNATETQVVGDLGTLNLSEGINTFVITTTAQDGLTSYTYKIVVNREYPLPYLADLAILNEQLLNESDKVTTFDKDTVVYHAIIANENANITINAGVDNLDYTVACSNSTVVTSTGSTRTFTVALAEGSNTLTIRVTNNEGRFKEYTLIAQRRPAKSSNTNIGSIDILETPQFKNEYTNSENNFGTYTVPNKIKDLTVNVVPEKVSDMYGDGATYKIYNDKNLRVGENDVIIVVTAEDGINSKVVVVKVIREAMKYDVNTNATDFNCELKDVTNKVYEISLGNKVASEITEEQYKSYITWDTATDNLNVEVISDITDPKCNEVVVKVSDGENEEYVIFKIKTTANQGDFEISQFVEEYFPWILLAIAVLFLTIVIICVNRDKYGSISKKRKNQRD